MRDLTQGSITRHILEMSVPIFVGMIFQTLYLLVDLYFVAELGEAAIAGVSAAANATFLVFAITQILAVGTVSLVAHAVGRRDRADAVLVFNQSTTLAALCSLIILIGGYAAGTGYMRSLAADEMTVAAGTEYFRWLIPGLALQFASTTMGSALRATGDIKPTVTAHVLSLIANVVLAPIFIAGWVTGRPMGVAGAGLATSVAILVSVVYLARYFRRADRFVDFDLKAMLPSWSHYKRILAIGLPAGGEMLLMSIYTAVALWAISAHGATVQAGFGVGSRIMQAIFLPAIAIAFASTPIVGQNFGAGQGERVKRIFLVCTVLTSIAMLLATSSIQLAPEVFVEFFTRDAAVVDAAVSFLTIASIGFIAQGIIFTCVSTFQGLGNTWPALVSAAVGLLLFAFPAAWLSARPDSAIDTFWYVSIAAIALHAVLSVALVSKRLRTMSSSLQRAAAAQCVPV